MTDTMCCVRCVKIKRWPDAFPTTIYAECWQCVWDAHMASKHPLPWAERRRIGKISRRIAQNQQIKAARDMLAASTIVSELVSSAQSGVFGD